MVLVNDARAAYAVRTKDGNTGRAWIKAGSMAGGNSCRAKHGFEAYISTLKAGMTKMNTQAASAAQATISSRVLADLAVLGIQQSA